MSWFQSTRIGLILGAALAINLVCTALAGSVLLTTVTDVVGFMAFLWHF